jgi:hypothetical protein
MNEIVLSAEQASILSSAEAPVAILRPDGSFLGWVSPTPDFIVPSDCPFTAEEIAAAEAKANAPGRWHSTSEMLEHLRSLDR